MTKSTVTPTMAVEAAKQLLSATLPFIEMEKDIKLAGGSTPNVECIVYARNNSVLTVKDFRNLKALAENFQRMVNDLEAGK